MIVGAAMLVGLVAQASSVTWAITNVKDIEGDALGTGHVYIFAVQGNAKADTSAWAGLAEKGKTALIDAVASANLDYSKTGAAGVFSAAEFTLPDKGVQPATKYSCYAVIFDTAEITDASHFYVTSATAASTTYNADASTKKTYTLTATSSATASNWYAVGATVTPEPTSAMLLLLGVAGLALKRKRA